MEFTGERFHPEVAGDIACEHLHRYVLCMNAVAGKRVLDLACGEGYGARMLAESATSVVGVDISEEAIAHCKQTYGDLSNAEFKVGSATQVPLDDASVDIVVSFETLEHLAEHEEMLAEILRVLTPDGQLIISTPDRVTYTEKTGARNPFHVRELNEAEFRSLLEGGFGNVDIYYQRMMSGSRIWNPEKPAQIGTTSFGNSNGWTDTPSMEFEALYMVACCGRGSANAPEFASSIFMHSESDPWADALSRTFEVHRALRGAQELAAEIAQLRTENAQLKQELKLRAGSESHGATSEAEIVFDQAPRATSETGYALSSVGEGWTISHSVATGQFYLRDVAAQTFPFQVDPGAPSASLGIGADGSIRKADKTVIDNGGNVVLQVKSQGELDGISAADGTLASIAAKGASGPKLALRAAGEWHLFKPKLKLNLPGFSSKR